MRRDYAVHSDPPSALEPCVSQRIINTMLFRFLTIEYHRISLLSLHALGDTYIILITYVVV